jgi:hypothetical protein
MSETHPALIPVPMTIIGPLLCWYDLRELRKRFREIEATTPDEESTEHKQEWALGRFIRVRLHDGPPGAPQHRRTDDLAHGRRAVVGYRLSSRRHPIHLGGRKTTRIGLALAGRKAGVVPHVGDW